MESTHSLPLPYAPWPSPFQGELHADAPAQFVGHPAGALVRRRGVPGVAHHQDGRGSRGADLRGVVLTGDRPVVAPARRVPAHEVPEDGRDLLELGQQLPRLLGSRPLLVVQARYEPLRMGRRAVVPRGVTVVVPVGQLQQFRPVAVLGRLERAGQARPARLAVQRQHDAGEGQGLGEPAPAGGRQRLRVDAVQKVHDLSGALPGFLAGGLEVVVKGALEPQGLVLGVAHRVGARVDDGVQHQPPHVLGEQVGVHTAEFGAVGDAEVVHPAVAEDLAHQVHVAGGVGRRDVRHQLSGGLLAALAEVRGVLEVGALLGGVVRGGVHRLGGLDRLVTAAAHTLAGGHPTRVPAHQVSPGRSARGAGRRGSRSWASWRRPNRRGHRS